MRNCCPNCEKEIKFLDVTKCPNCNEKIEWRFFSCDKQFHVISPKK